MANFSLLCICGIPITLNYKPMAKTFLQRKGNYRGLIVFRKAECIYDITYYFAHKYLMANDRTVDQMIQAARSGRQNIAEGCEDGTASVETEIKLLSVAKGSLQELLLDYEDYLRVRNLTLWDINSEKALQTRRVCARNNDSAFYRKAIVERSDETICNIAITLIHQTDMLLWKYIEKLQADFIQNGGIKEKMYKARTNYRGNHEA